MSKDTNTGDRQPTNHLKPKIKNITVDFFDKDDLPKLADIKYERVYKKKIIDIKGKENPLAETLRTWSIFVKCPFWSNTNLLFYPESPRADDIKDCILLKNLVITFIEEGQRKFIEYQIPRFFIKKRVKRVIIPQRRHYTGYFIKKTIFEVHEEYVDKQMLFDDLYTQFKEYENFKEVFKKRIFNQPSANFLI